MDIKNAFDIIFDSSNIDWECSKIAHLMGEYVLNNVEELLDAECYKAAIEQFFCVTEACCEHFISDEHWEAHNCNRTFYHLRSEGWGVCARLGLRLKQTHSL